MKVSYNWLKQYVDVDMSAEQAADILTEIGLEVEGIEEHESIPGGLKGLVIGHVLESGKHPNADKLSVNMVDLGGDEPVQIVCGAPNVGAGQKVVVAPPKTTIYPINGDPFTLKKAKIRGYTSHGMICAEDEIGIGHDHDGIIVLPDEAKAGTPASDYYNIETDIIFEVGLTPNRSDATSHLGAAKDFAAALKVNHGHSGVVNIPSVKAFKVDNNSMPIEVVVENPTACPRYSGVVIKGVTIKESPDWLKERLNAIGVRPLSNVVDITNFILHELGQPLHAFDYAEITGKKVIVKCLEEGAKFTTLDEVERTLSAEDLMICDGDGNGMCIGGVFGGVKSGVKDNTTDIFLESAHFSPRSIRRSSTRHGLRTDAARTFEKGSDPNGTVYALKRAALLIQELAGGEIASEVIDIYPTTIEKAQIDVVYSNVTRLIGKAITNDEIKNILAALHIDILEETAEGVKVAIPTDKHDVTREADVIEEILRIYGINNIDIPQKVKSSLSWSPAINPYAIQETVGEMLSGNGFFEMMGLSITQSKYFKEILPIADEKLVYINNTSNIHLDIMRPSMLFTGLEAIERNQNRQNSNVKLYEFGKSYLSQGDGNYKETKHLTIFISGKQQEESWLNTNKADASFYDLKAQVTNILQRVGMTNYQVSAYESDVLGYGLKFHRGKQIIARFGRVQPKIVKKMGIKLPVFFADIEWGLVLKAIQKTKIRFAELPKYFYSRRDLAMVIDKSVHFSDIEAIARKQGKKLLKEVNLFDVYENEKQLGKGKKSYAVSFIFQDADKTLKDKDVDKIIKKMIGLYELKLGAVIRK